MAIAADAAPQLMQLGQAEALGVLDDHDARVRHVHPHLDDRRRHKNVNLAGGERLHHALFAVRLHAAVQQADAVGGEDLLSEMIVHLGGRLEIDLVGFFDQRVDDVRLPAGVELLPDKLVDFVAPRFRLGDGLDGQPARRHVADHRDVQVAVHRERERARDRRRRHHEHVGMQPLRAQRRALQHAETVLLVDDDQAQRREAHVALDERVRADHQMHAARFDLGQLLPARRARRRPRQERHAEA